MRRILYGLVASMSLVSVMGAMVAALGLLASAPALASAEVVYEPGPSFETTGLSGPAGVAVDNSSGPSKGSVYVANTTTSTLEKFSSAGVPENFSELGSPEIAVAGTSGYDAVDNFAGPSEGDIYVGAFGPVYQYAPGGKLVATIEATMLKLGEPLEASGVTVDPETGALFVIDRHNGGALYKLEEESLGKWKVARTTSIGAQAWDSLAAGLHGEVYVTGGGANLKKFNAAGVEEAFPAGASGAQSVAVDPSNGDVFVGEPEGGGMEIAHYSSTGTSLSPKFGAGMFGGIGAYGIAVSGQTHTVYASSYETNTVSTFKVQTKAAEVKTGPAENITTTSATITGTVKPVEAPEATEIEFEWGPKGEVSKNKVPASVTSTTAEVTVHAALSGLEVGTEYVYRLSAKAGGETIDGAETPLSTLSLATVTTEPASEVKIEGATLNGKLVVSPGVEEKGEYYFEYTPEGGSATKTTATPFSGKEVTLSVPVSSLEAGKKYDYHLVAVVEGHTITGTPLVEVEFQTPALATVKTELVTEVKAENAKLNGELSLNPEVTEGEYYFEYGEEGSVEPQTKTALKSFTSSGKVSESVVLLPDKHYVYKLIAVVKAKNIEGGVEKFETLGLAPSITNSPLCETCVTRHSATLSGEINPENSKTEYFIEYGETETYGAPGSPTATVSLPEPTGKQTIAPVTLEELTPGTVYHYRIVAINETGTEYGPDATFETQAPQPPFVLAVASDVTSQTTATLRADVDADGLQTSYVLEVGTEVAPGDIAYTPTFGEVGNSEEPVQLTFPQTGLLPGTTYHWRIVLNNEDGTFTGADHTFATPGFAAAITSPPLVTLIPFTPPKEEVKKPAPKPETRAQKYAKALKQCKKDKSKSKRAKCMKTAHKRYGPPHKQKRK